MKTGWMRLWIVISTTWICSWSLFLWTEIHNQPSCYRYVTVSIENNVDGDIKKRAERTQKELQEGTFCTDKKSFYEKELENLANKKVIAQTAVIWLGPYGWDDKRDKIDDIFGEFNEKTLPITVGNITASVETGVLKERLASLKGTVFLVIIIPLLLLLFGKSVAWIRAGFKE